MALLSADRFWKRLRSGAILLSDGAIGSELIGKGIAAEAVTKANLSHSTWVQEVHQRNLAAGAELITTNTFGLCASKSWLDELAAAVSIATDAAKGSAREVGVWLSLPRPGAETMEDCLRSLRVRIAKRPEMVLIETCTCLGTAIEIMRAAAMLEPTVLAVTAHFGADNAMPDGTSAEQFVRSAADAGAQVVGANCGSVPEHFIDITRRMRSATSLPLLIQPSAGLPQQNSAGEWVYPASPQAFAEVGASLVGAGANIVGGCCGASPAHIAALCARLAEQACPH
jgi:methionine synthase I (cobalamin-dependent)